ncbi:MAG: hypothetical protein QOH54_536 [Mycobacterium sp.]|nr:hypothetical protein [Mycobacterium sp.]
MDCVCAMDEVRAHFAESDGSHLARGDEFAHRADGVFDRHTAIQAMVVVQVDHVGPQTAEAVLARRPDVVRAAVNHDARAVVIDLRGEFRRQHHVIAAAGERRADEFLVVAEAANGHSPPDVRRTVDIGGVQKVHSQVKRCPDRIDRLTVIRSAVEL